MRTLLLATLFVLGTSCLKQETSSRKHELTSEVRTEVIIDDNRIEFLHDAKASDGRDCHTNIKGGNSISYKIENNILILDDGEEVMRFQRIEGNDDSLVGIWKSKATGDKVQAQTTLIFDSLFDLKIIEKCRYQR